VLGIRPEDIEDASLARDAVEEAHLSVVCDIREDMGSEVYVHFNVAADPVVSEEVIEAMTIDRPEDEEARIAAERARGSGVSFVARLDRTTDARERGELVVAVDLERLHFFDPHTGLRIAALE